MAGTEKNLTLTGMAGYVPNQPLFRDGLPDTVLGGENVLVENDAWRAFGGYLDKSEDRSDSAYAQTAATTANSTSITLSADIPTLVPRQHMLIDGALHLVYSIGASRTAVVVRPAVAGTAAAAVLKPVPVINRLHFDRATQNAGNSVFHQNAIFTVGAGVLKKNGTALSPSMTASDTLQVSYDNGTAVYNAGFTDPSAPTAVDGSGGSKVMPVTTYPVALIRKRTGFSGQGNPGPRGYATTTVLGNKIKVTLPAFATSEGQNAWLIAVPRRADLNAGVFPQDAGLWEYPIEFTTPSTDVEIEWYDEDLIVECSYDNDAPPKALYVGSLDSYLILGSTDGDPKNGTSSTPGAFLAASKKNNPEAFSPFARARTPNSELICGMHVAQYVAYLLTDNGLMVASLTGNAVSPFTVRQEWGFGFLHHYNGIVINDQFFGLAGQNLYRTAGSGRDRTSAVKDPYSATDDFAVRIRPDLKTIEPARAFLGSDLQRTHLVLFYSCAEKRSSHWVTKAWVYNLQTGLWSPPVILALTGADCIVTGTATVESQLYFTCSNGKTYLWDRGTQTQAGYLLFPFLDAGSNNSIVAGRITITGDLDGKPELYKNLKLDDAKAGTSPAAQRPAVFVSSGKVQSFSVWQPSINCESVALKVNFLTMPAAAQILSGAFLDYLAYEGFRR